MNAVPDERKWPHVAPVEVWIGYKKNLVTERVVKHWTEC